MKKIFGFALILGAGLVAAGLWSGANAVASGDERADVVPAQTGGTGGTKKTKAHKGDGGADTGGAMKGDGGM